MDLLKLYEQRETLNGKMRALLLKGLQDELQGYRASCENMDEATMARLGTPFILMLESKIQVVEALG